VPATAPSPFSEPVLGRRERKRLETRQSLVDAAVTLFTQHGFDQVTVVDIADSADVDQSTFFRHFGSKEAVLFTDMADFTDHVGSMLDNRPADESLLDAIVGSMVDLASRRQVVPEMEFLRAKLTRSSPVLQAQMLVYRERLVEELATAIGRRVGVDASVDPMPYLAATLWAATLDFYRRRAVAAKPSRRNPAKALSESLDEVLGILRAVWPTDVAWS
jgi:AcrR family transcriptional regulator